jgi:integrase
LPAKGFEVAVLGSRHEGCRLTLHNAAEISAQGTLWSKRRALKEILRYTQLCGAPATVTMRLAHVHKAPARRVRATDVELARILDSAPRWLRCFCIVAGRHGLRMSEALQLSVAYYNQTEGTTSFATKGFQHNTLPVSDELAGYFRTAPLPEDKTTPLVLRQRGRKVNENLRPHDPRRTIALNAWAQTKDLKVCQAILGQKSLATTAIYLEGYRNPELRDTMRGLTVGTPGQNPSFQI